LSPEMVRISMQSLVENDCRKRLLRRFSGDLRNRLTTDCDANLRTPDKDTAFLPHVRSLRLALAVVASKT
jgi:hypothetical protein